MAVTTGQSFTFSGTTFSTRLIFIEKARAKEGSMLEWANRFHDAHGVLPVFIRKEVVYSETVLNAAIHHFIMDRFVRQIKASNVPALDMIAHLTCTTQVHDIQAHAIPEGMNEKGSYLHGVILVLIMEGDISDLGDRWERFRKTLDLEMLEPLAKITKGENTIIDKLALSLVLDEEGGVSDVMEERYEVHEWEQRALLSSMARFSLDLQLKFQKKRTY